MGISREQALDCFRSNDLVGIGMEADAVRRRIHPDGIVGYVNAATIDLSALSAWSSEQELERVYAKVADAVDRGATAIHLSGSGEAAHTDSLLTNIRRQFPQLWIEGFSLANLTALAADSNSNLADLISRLMHAGLDSIADNGFAQSGSDPAADRTQLTSWLDMHRTAHGLGMQTVAGLIFGVDQTPEQCVNLLEAISRLQDQTGGFAAIAPQAAAPPNGRNLDGVTAVERLKTLAITRMFLDTIENVQATATSEGLKVLQMSLRFGANDVGPIALAPGHEEDVRRIVRDAGFRPAQREMGYHAMIPS